MHKPIHWILTLCLSALLASCSSERDPLSGWGSPSNHPTNLPKSRYGNPLSYHVNGDVYRVLDSAVGYRKRGMASWYGKKFNGRLTSTREVYNMYALTAASPELPIPCYVRVTNLLNHRSLIVKVNDRGPFARGRIIDLSYAAAKRLGYARRGTAPVLVESLQTENSPRSTKKHHFSPAIYWQTGVFSTLKHANKQRKFINRYCFPFHARITETHKNNHTLYRVTIGPLRTALESDKLYRRLKQLGLRQAIPLTRD